MHPLCTWSRLRAVQDEGLFDDVLGAPLVNEEIGPDESAVSSAGLIHPDDMELEMIMAEHRSEEAPEETPAEEETTEADVLPEEAAEEWNRRDAE